MIPVFLTVLRFIAAPFVGWAIIHGNTHMAAGLFLAAAVTDWLDGFVARACNQETEIGACLDPLADKLLFMVTVWALVMSQYAVTLPAWFFWLLFTKELSLIIGAFWAKCCDKKFVVRPLRSAKFATAWLSVLVVYILFCPLLGWYHEALYSLFFAIALYFVIISWVLYGYEGYERWLK